MTKRLFISLLTLCLFAAMANAAAPKHIVFMIGEDEYHTWETLPDLAQKELKAKGYRITIIQADPQDKNRFPGIVEALHDADLLFLSVRRRFPPKEQLEAVRAYLTSGKPLVGIRTTCHAFALRPNEKAPSPENAVWQEFDPEVLGGHYVGHHGKDKVAVSLAPGAEKNPILQGVAIDHLVGNGGLYKVSPLNEDTTKLLIGTIPNEPSEPIAWTRLYGPKKNRIFYTSLGHPDDFQEPDFRKFLVNAVAWALGE
jgi:type 1 glutamine amidotransferase